MDDRARVWFARVAAPLAFLAAATLLVVLVQRALDGDEDAGSTTVTVQTDTASIVTTEGSTTEQEPAEEQFYEIRPGDTLAAIAQRFDTTVEELEQLNPGIDPLALEPGQTIRVR